MITTNIDEINFLRKRNIGEIKAVEMDFIIEAKVQNYELQS